MILLLSASGFLTVAVVTFFVLVCLLLVFMVVITPSQEGGIAAAFGGLGSESFFGTKAHQHINKFTVFLAVAFLLLAVVINKMNSSRGPGEGAGIEQRMKELPPAPSPPGPPPK